MKLAALALLPGLATAHRGVDRRQATTTAASAPSSSATAAAGGGGGYTVTTTISGQQILTTYSIPPTASFSLLSTNPTAVPLASIVAGAPSQVSIPLYTTFTAGASPTAVPGAPPLPDISTLNPANYPALDVTPPTDSPEVQAWIQEVQNSGVQIPNITATLPGGCPSNEAAVSDTSRCWWTCGGCVRPSDITTCPDPMTWGITYDDGPSPWTPNLLEFLDQNNLKSTFFVIGSRGISRPDILQTEYMIGHQIGLHTWSHPPMTTLTNDELIAEFGWTRKLFQDVLGVTPNMWRPPYGDIDDRVRAIGAAMGLTPVIWTRLSPTSTFDTNDYNIAGDLVSASEVLSNWDIISHNATTIDTGFILLEHDLFQQTVDIATGYILPDALAFQPSFNIKPVVECLNMPMTNAYVETNDNSTFPPAQSEAPAPTTFSSSAAYSSVASSASASSSTSKTSGSGASSSGGSAQSGAGAVGVDGFVGSLVAVAMGAGALLL